MANDVTTNDLENPVARSSLGSVGLIGTRWHAAHIDARLGTPTVRAGDLGEQVLVFVPMNDEFGTDLAEEVSEGSVVAQAANATARMRSCRWVVDRDDAQLPR
jgi:hypothetical protein